jgi:hypothetical protein
MELDVLIARAGCCAALMLATAVPAQTSAVSPPPASPEAAPPAPAVPVLPAPPPPIEESPPPAPVPNEIVIPQYPEGTTPPTSGPVTLTPAAMLQWREQKLSFASGSNDVVQGINGVRVDRVAFYQLVGRPDLAARQEDGRRRQIWLIAGGIAVSAAGLIGGIALSNSNEATITYTSTPGNGAISCPTSGGGQLCYITNQSWQNWVGLSLVIVGLVGGGILVALGLVADNPITTVKEDKDLVGVYNDVLLQRLSGNSARPSSMPAVGVGVGSGGGMVQARWNF